MLGAGDRDNRLALCQHPGERELRHRATVLPGERPEAVDAGTVQLVGTDTDAIFDAATTLLDDEARYNVMAKAINPYGDGNASARIIRGLLGGQ